LVDIGVLEPQGREPARWQFGGASLQRARRALRLQRDLDIDLAGAALALQLLDEIESLRSRLRVIGGEY
jgi:chaperone modulatory protein CbpM